MPVKTLGKRGEIYLGKQYSGRTVQVEEIDKGVLLIKLRRAEQKGSPPSSEASRPAASGRRRRSPR